MVRIQTDLPYTSSRRDPRPGELPSDDTQTGTARRRSYQEEAPLLRVILPARAQPSRRCETQAPLSGKPPSCAKCFGPLTASARSGNLIAGDGTKNGPFPLRTKNQQKPKTNSLTGKAPYKFESISLQRRVRYELRAPHAVQARSVRRGPSMHADGSILKSEQHHRRRTARYR
jgi:hypothetical protein